MSKRPQGNWCSRDWGFELRDSDVRGDAPGNRVLIGIAVVVRYW